VSLLLKITVETLWEIHSTLLGLNQEDYQKDTKSSDSSP